ncbi:MULTISPECIES: ABC transporter permease subunit [Bradyrhizobium]|uniref:ABC transporter permease subunit n=1 Tax=Bradyrhizobium TaxID=374 RepID=UPI00005DE6E2|nr:MULTISPECIES: ABC transporter permease subunit [Bradyrhizobium]ABQ34692.1 Putative taurine ABC transporter, permease protein [Bradyrhizobium sp. BTAi1]MCL8483785.1 ABC transporter permease subunit [Bradyrhizobium denitrificans]
MSEAEFAADPQSSAVPATATEDRSTRARGPALALTTIATVAGLFALWWLVAAAQIVPPLFLPSPLAVLGKLISVSADGFEGATLIQHTLASLARIVAALLAAIVVGTLTGLAIALSPRARGIIEPLLEFYRPIPPLAYLPLVIIWFGIGEFAKVLVIYLGILPSIVIATVDGLRSVAPDRVNAARSLGASRWQVIGLVLLPHALPSILTGIRIGLGTGWATLVAAELVAATRGLGFMIKGASDFLVTDVVVLGILVIAVIAFALELALRVVQRVLVPWQGRD